MKGQNKQTKTRRRRTTTTKALADNILNIRRELDRRVMAVS